MPTTSLVRRLPGVLLPAAVLAFSVLMFTKVVPYLSFARGIGFLSTKTDRVLDNPWFLTAFYVHITSSLWVMGSGALQFVPLLSARFPKLHRQLGKLYVGSVLLLAAPSGLVLAFFANGGLPAQAGFVLQCLVWWLTTYVAFREAAARQWLPHVEWMMRSLAVTLAAMSLRLESYALYYGLHTKPIETYLTVTWLSWTGNLLLTEILIRAGVARSLLRKFYGSPKTPAAV
ncbi:MAG: DUF2306 domain-containing protein [Cytophagales bacterium]|nr:DUF2306 domain-containing protein [Cytophagales bacterium]